MYVLFHSFAKIFGCSFYHCCQCCKKRLRRVCVCVRVYACECLHASMYMLLCVCTCMFISWRHTHLFGLCVVLQSGTSLCRHCVPLFCYHSLLRRFSLLFITALCYSTLVCICFDAHQIFISFSLFVYLEFFFILPSIVCSEVFFFIMLPRAALL